MKNSLKSSLLVALIILTGTVAVMAQLLVSIKINPQPDPYPANWSTTKNTVTVTVTNKGLKPVEAKFDCKINIKSVLQVNTKPESMPTIQLPPGESLFNAVDLLPFDAVNMAEIEDKTAYNSAMLPKGVYEFCVTLIEPKTNNPLTLTVCNNFKITGTVLSSDTTKIVPVMDMQKDIPQK